MSSPLIDALTARQGFETVNAQNLDAFLKRHPQSVLFFAGDSERLVESGDVAVILPELVKAFGGRLTPALVEKQAERALQLRFRFNAFPALVFMRGEGYLGVITRVLDWQDYLSEIAEILSRGPSEPPPYQFPDGCIPSTASGAEHGHSHPGQQPW
jgi:hydrogenase-1 operon protein HyaE